jgi:hypothetical protein
MKCLTQFGLSLHLDDQEFWVKIIRSSKEQIENIESQEEMSFIENSEDTLELLSLWQGQEL